MCRKKQDLSNNEKLRVAAICHKDDRLPENLCYDIFVRQTSIIQLMKLFKSAILVMLGLEPTGAKEIKALQKMNPPALAVANNIERIDLGKFENNFEKMQD